MSAPGSSRREGVIIGSVFVAFAILVGFETAAIPTEAVYAQVGPAIVPWIVTAMLAVLGCATIAASLFGRWYVAEPPEQFHLRPLAWVGLGLFLNVAAIQVLGFILASTALFVCTARGFGSGRPLRDAAVGFALAFLSYLGFDRLLGYSIGTGLIENLI